MEERVRFTGENPPVHLWTRFPNWQNAYEEEGLPGQNEATLRPADNQQAIDDRVSFTAGDAVLANGKRVPALLAVLSGRLGWIYVYPEPPQDVCWALHYRVPFRRWIAMNDEWFLQGAGHVRVPVGDAATFPIEVTSRLPLLRSGEIIAIKVEDPG